MTTRLPLEFYLYLELCRNVVSEVVEGRGYFEHVAEESLAIFILCLEPKNSLGFMVLSATVLYTPTGFFGYEGHRILLRGILQCGLMERLGRCLRNILLRVS